MAIIVIPVIISGLALGVLVFFIIKTVIAPKQLSSLANMIKQGKYSSATRHAKKILSRDPRNVQAHFLLGEAYRLDGKPELALMEFKQINTLGKFEGFCEEKDFRSKTAALYEKFGQTEEALKEYLLLIALEKEEPNYYFKAGQLFEARKKRDKAILYYRKTIELDSRHSEAHSRLGTIYYQLKKHTEAKALLEKAIKLDSSNYQASFYIGKIIKESKDFYGALDYFETAEKDPEIKVKALIERGGCFMASNEYERAISELERAAKLSPSPDSAESLYSRYFLGICYEKTRNIDKSIEYWEQVYAIRPDFKDVAEKLSQFHDLRSDDKIKDYLTTGKAEFAKICKTVTKQMNLSIQQEMEIPNGFQFIAIETESGKWLNTKKLPKLIRFLRIPDMIEENAVRELYEEMKKTNITKAILVTSSTFSRLAIDFAAQRPIDLLNKDQLLNFLNKIDMDDPLKL